MPACTRGEVPRRKRNVVRAKSSATPCDQHGSLQGYGARRPASGSARKSLRGRDISDIELPGRVVQILRCSTDVALWYGGKMSSLIE
eukprot:scaffold5709_cov125-Isochrysis_galbana.AAC.1